MRLKNRAAIVTGAAAGLGLAIAEKLASEGASLLLVDRDAANLQKEAERLKAQALAADISKPEDAEAMADTCVRLFGRLDILVNNAGVAGTYAFLDQPLDHWQKVMAVNLTGTFLCGQSAARRMAKSGYGRIVNIASVSGIRAGTGRTAYGTSKAGVIGLTRQMALELAPMGILVNAVAPGPVDTAMTRAIHTPESRQAYYDRIPQGRYGLPEEIANAVAFLASEEASYVNGQVISVDGGYVAAGIIAADVLEKPRTL